MSLHQALSTVVETSEVELQAATAWSIHLSIYNQSIECLQANGDSQWVEKEGGVLVENQLFTDFVTGAIFASGWRDLQ